MKRRFTAVLIVILLVLVCFGDLRRREIENLDERIERVMVNTTTNKVWELLGKPAHVVSGIMADETYSVSSEVQRGIGVGKEFLEWRYGYTTLRKETYHSIWFGKERDNWAVIGRNSTLVTFTVWNRLMQTLGRVLPDEK
jgi:hypothetical protein